MRNARTPALNAGRNARQMEGSWRVVFLLMFIYPTFLHLLPRQELLGLFLAACCLSVVVLFVDPHHFTTRSNAALGLVLLLPMALLGLLADGSMTYDFAVFIALIPIIALLSFKQGWVQAATSVALLLLGIHGSATLAFFLSPALFESVKNSTRLSMYSTAWDYRSGLTAHYSYNGMYMALGLILASTVAFSPRSVLGSKAICLLGTALFAIGLILTTKRGPLIIAAVAVTVVLFALRERKGPARRSRKGKLTSFALVALATVIFVTRDLRAQQVIGRLMADTSGVDEYSSGRLALWGHALELWQSAPLFGIGWGGFRYEWMDGGTQVVSVGAHNVLLQLLAETGILGTSVFVAIYALCLVGSIADLKAVRQMDSLAGRRAHTVLAGGVGIQVFFGLYAMVGNPLYDPPTFVAYFLAVAACAGAGGFLLSAGSTDETRNLTLTAGSVPEFALPPSFKAATRPG